MQIPMSTMMRVPPQVIRTTRKKPQKSKTTLPADGPTASHVHAQNTMTGTPTVCLPPLEADKPTNIDAEHCKRYP